MSGELVAVGCEGQQPASRVHQAAYLQAVVVPPLAETAALSGPNHVAVAALDAGRKREK